MAIFMMTAMEDVQSKKHDQNELAKKLVKAEAMVVEL
jgi:hypothetical protein